MIKAASAAAAVAAVVAGCATTVPGSVALTTEAAPAGQVDLVQLDPGNYPTTARPPLGKAGDEQHGQKLEALRMANYVVGPWEVDPALVPGSMADTVDAKLLDQIFGVGVGDTAVGHHLIAGFATQRTSPVQGKSLVHVVLRFPAPGEAAAAAVDMAAKSFNTPATPGGEPVPYQPTAIPRHPETSGMSHLWDDKGHWSTMAFTAHGPFVLGQFSSSTDSTDPATELVATMLDRQAPLIDRFQPTPTDQLKDLPIDPDGLLAHTIPSGTGDGWVTEPRAQLHRDNDPARTKPVFDRAHLQQVSHGAATVYQTPDVGSAQKVVDGFAADVAEVGLDGHKFVPAAGVDGLPGAKCFKPAETGATPYYCLVVADRYAIEVASAQERDAHQRISAQYLMLTGK